MKKRIIALMLTAALALSAAGCAASGGNGTAATEAPAAATDTPAAAGNEAAVFENSGLKLTVPAEYKDLVIVRTDVPDALFSVSEKASVEAGERLRTAEGKDPAEDNGDGWLFSISHVDQARLHELLCEDMSGVEVIARAGDGSAFLYNHPTDVRLVRDGENAYSQENLDEWSFVCEWASAAADRFVSDNSLIAYTRSNTGLDIALSRIAYRDGTEYSLTSLSHGSFSPEGVDAAPYLDALTALTYEWADSTETPDGEYIVLNLPAEETRFDFFLGGDGSYVREVRGENETLYRAKGGADVISPVKAWYDALAAANGVDSHALSAYEDAVQAVLDEYAALDAAALENYDEGAHPELPWYTAVIANTERNNLYYGFHDFDGNGVNELIVAAGDDSFQIPEGIYAFDGAEMHYLCKEQPLGERAYLSYNGEYFAVRASGGAAQGSVALYKIAADGFGTDLIEIMDYEYKDENTVVYTPEKGNMTAEEFAAFDLPESFDLPIEYTLFASRRGGDMVGMANPWTDTATLEEAVKGAGLESFVLPQVYSCFADSHSEGLFRYMDGLVEVILDDVDNRLVLRKGLGSEDISGDYNMYPEEWDINWKGLNIHCRGEKGNVRTACWFFNGCAYSLSFNADALGMPGLSEDSVCSLVNQIS